MYEPISILIELDRDAANRGKLVLGILRLTRDMSMDSAMKPS